MEPTNEQCYVDWVQSLQKCQHGFFNFKYEPASHNLLQAQTFSFQWVGSLNFGVSSDPNNFLNHP